MRDCANKPCKKSQRTERNAALETAAPAVTPALLAPIMAMEEEDMAREPRARVDATEGMRRIADAARVDAIVIFFFLRERMWRCSARCRSLKPQRGRMMRQMQRSL